MGTVISRGLSVVFGLFSLAAMVAAQDEPVKGVITDETTRKPVEYAHIQNYSQKKQIYTNSKGQFVLDMKEGDTLVVYAMGYYYRKIIVDREDLVVRPVVFSIGQQAFDLSEARIIALGDYNSFRQKIITFDKPKTKTENLNNYIAGVSHIAAKEAYEKARDKKMSEGITFVSVPILTPEEKERIKLGKILEEEKIHDQIYQKFNPLVVKKITGLEKDDEIIEFMLFCRFSDSYLLEVSEYDLSERIALKFRLYKKKKEDEELMKEKFNRIETESVSLAMLNL